MSDIINQTVNHVIHFCYPISSFASSGSEEKYINFINSIGNDMANYLNENEILWKFNPVKSGYVGSLIPMWQETHRDAIVFNWNYNSSGSSEYNQIWVYPRTYSLINNQYYDINYSLRSNGAVYGDYWTTAINSSTREGNINISGKYSPEKAIYLNMIKSKTGRSFAFSFTYAPTNSMVFLFAEDENNKFGAFLLAPKNNSSNYGDYHMLYSSYGMHYNNKYIVQENTNSNLGLITPYPISFPGAVTSLGKLANPFGGCYFKEIYSIFSTPLNKQGIVDNSFLVDGKKFKGIGATQIGVGDPSSSDIYYRGLDGAGPFAMEVE